MFNAHKNMNKSVAPGRLNRKIAKHIKRVEPCKPKTKNSIDLFLEQCFAMHRSLEQSSRILCRFQKELHEMSTFLNDMRRDDMMEDITVYDEQSECDGAPNHRSLFDMLDTSDMKADKQRLENLIKDAAVPSNNFDHNYVTYKYEMTPSIKNSSYIAHVRNCVNEKSFSD